ncbi:hypothetical protein J2S13_003014 [Oikeobacillus pervagus]|uniref:Hydrolase n=1 Tax=Oikeobacillus pervagus TaxID=1325931 RepID=A0AAJ1T3I0_9BACI|nr:hydrolase [Oikeobacillus pervagus]MDQ0216552.1 hypothetical protein [Oikeobacillus pervagus]
MPEDQKKTYYIHIGNGEILSNSTASPWNFRIYANDDEITRLREIFDANYSVEWKNFYRAHVPYIQYHYDRENDHYDLNMKKVYEMIYALGDEEAKDHIKVMGILDEEERIE